MPRQTALYRLVIAAAAIGSVGAGISAAAALFVPVGSPSFWIDLGVCVANVLLVPVNLRAGLRIRAGVALGDFVSNVRYHEMFDPAAAARAQELLLRLLTPEQRKEYLDRRQFTVRTERALYSLGAGRRLMMRRPGECFYAACIELWREPHDLPLPPADRLIALLLMIRTDEEGLWERFGPQRHAYRIVPGDTIVLPGGLSARVIH